MITTGNTCGTSGSVQVLCVCMLVANGGLAHPWQTADRHGQEAEACRQLLLHFGARVWQRADVVYDAQQQQSQVGSCCLPDPSA